MVLSDSLTPTAQTIPSRPVSAVIRKDKRNELVSGDVHLGADHFSDHFMSYFGGNIQDNTKFTSCFPRKRPSKEGTGKLVFDSKLLSFFAQSLVYHCSITAMMEITKSFQLSVTIRWLQQLIKH